MVSTSLPFDNEARFRTEALELLASWDGAIQIDDREMQMSTEPSDIPPSTGDTPVSQTNSVVKPPTTQSPAPVNINSSLTVVAEGPRHALAVAIAHAAAALHDRLRLPGDLTERTALMARHFAFLASVAARSSASADTVLTDAAGSALAALVRANADVALVSLADAVHQSDEFIRAAFLDALSRALHSGALDASPPPPPKDAVERFVDALTLADMAGALAVLSTAGQDLDAVAMHLVRVCAARGRAMDLLFAAIDSEIAAAGLLFC